MPKVTHETIFAATPDTVWEYVKDLRNWAPFVVGYRSVRVIDDRNSVWTLHGDLGMMTREVEVEAEIVEWEPLDRVSFVVKGITEPFEGRGSFVLSGDVESAASAEPERRSILARLRLAMGRVVFRALARRETRTGSASTRHAIEPIAGDGTGTRIRLELEITPLGSMAPMIEVLMAPLVEPAAEDLAHHIRLAVEATATDR